MTAADWSKVHPRLGDWICSEHGIIKPWRQLVPACPDCLRVAHHVVGSKTGLLVYEEPTPKTCGGPDQHPLKPGRVQLGTSACSCSASGIHRSWTCAECGDQQVWPPHSDVDADPYFGPGSG